MCWSECECGFPVTHAPVFIWQRAGSASTVGLPPPLCGGGMGPATICAMPAVCTTKWTDRIDPSLNPSGDWWVQLYHLLTPLPISPHRKGYRARNRKSPQCKLLLKDNLCLSDVHWVVLIGIFCLGFWYNLLIVASEGGLIAAWSQIETIVKIPHIHTQNIYKALETASSDNLWW